MRHAITADVTEPPLPTPNCSAPCFHARMMPDDGLSRGNHCRKSSDTGDHRHQPASGPLRHRITATQGIAARRASSAALIFSCQLIVLPVVIFVSVRGHQCLLQTLLLLLSPASTAVCCGFSPSLRNSSGLYLLPDSAWLAVCNRRKSVSPGHKAHRLSLFVHLLASGERRT